MLTVLVFLIDGLGYHFLPQRHTWRTHTVACMQTQRNTVTSPNWATLLSGLTVRAHGVVSNEQVSAPSFEFSHETIMSDFKRAHAMGRCVLVTNWRPLHKMVAQDCDDVHVGADVWSLARDILQTPSLVPRLVVVNTDRLDHVAHDHGWGSVHYHRTLRNMTRAVDYLRRLATVTVITADHGGEPGAREHDDHTSAHVRTVPLVHLSRRRVASGPRSNTGFRAWMRQHYDRRDPLT